MALKRRQFIQAGVAGVISAQIACGSKTSARHQVVVVGGGFAGATAAKYIKLWSDDIDVVLIEKNPQFVSCPQSNLVLSGNRILADLTQDYTGLEVRGVRRVQATVTAVDTAAQYVSLDDGVQIKYDRLIIAPGVDFIYDALPTLFTAESQQRVPHAWKAGVQTQLLRDQLLAMPQGGVVAMTVPRTPFRCPPGPYERACQIALYLRQHNPRGKLIVLDENPQIASKKSLFETVWQTAYAGLIEYIPNSRLESVDVASLTAETEFDSVKADVLNVIPPQKAGNIAAIAGVINIDNRWCDVDFLSYESTVKAKVHVIGDAVAAKLPKSGHMANAQAKVCAAAVIALLADTRPIVAPVFNNTCYSFIDGKQAVHVAAVYRYNAEKKEMLPMAGGGISAKATVSEGKVANAWAQTIWQDTLG